MRTVRVYGDYNLIALQALDTDELEGCEFSSKFRAETISRNMEKLMACVGHYNYPSYSKTWFIFLYRVLQRKFNHVFEFRVAWVILVSDTCHYFISPLFLDLNFVESSQSSKPSTFKS